MQTEITLNDFFSFLKKNLKLILITSLIFLLAGSTIVAFQEFRNYSSFNRVEEEVAEETAEETLVDNGEIERLYNTDPEELTMAETEILDNYLLRDAYYFTVLIEEPDFSPYNRANLMHEFLMSEQVLEQLEQEIGTTIQPSPEQAIRNSYNESNVLHTFTFTTGDRETNQALADAVYDVVLNKELPILENRYIYPKATPTLLELDTGTQDELEMESSEKSTSSLVIRVILTGIVSFVLGLIFGMILAFIREKFSDEISYLYTYPVNKRDIVMRYDAGTEVNNDSVIHVIKTPINLEKVVILGDSDQRDKIQRALNDYSSINVVSSIAEMASNKSIDEAIILVNINETSKKWFKQQMDILEIHDVHKKILVLNV